MSLDARMVSVVTAVRNCERYVGAAIDSILEQTQPPGEIVVVDDGSTDGTPAILDSFGAAVRVVRRSVHSAPAAINIGVDAAQGSLLGFLDADDLWTPQSLEVRLERINAADDPDGVYGHLDQFVSPELGPDVAARLRFDPSPRAAPLLQALLVRRHAFARVGPLDEGLRTLSNLEWLSRASTLLEFVEIPDVVGRRRLHDANLSLTAGEQKRGDMLRIVRAHRDRTRDPGSPPRHATDPT